MTNSSAYLDKILTFVSYDAAASEILDHFASVKQNTECLFARTSKIWGARPFLSTLSLEDNVFRYQYLDIILFMRIEMDFSLRFPIRNLDSHLNHLAEVSVAL
jgi:hypothetical protein